MKNWIRIAFIFVFLVSSAGFFGFYSLSQINSALDSVSSSYNAVVDMSLESFSSRTIAAVEDTQADPSGIVLNASTSTDPVSILTLPEERELYIGCTYQIPLVTSAPISVIKTSLVDAESEEVSGPIASGLSKEYEFEPEVQSFEWKVGTVWPGDYFILVSNINEVEVDMESEHFAVRRMDEDIDLEEQEVVCEESGGAL